MLTDRVRDFIDERKLLKSGERVVVGVSGGVDSVVLLDILLHLSYQPVVVHINYQLRGKDSDDDEEFVRSLCAEKDVPLYVERFDTRSIVARQKRPVQDVARELRYRAFAGLARRLDHVSIAVGQHLDDQIETVILHFFRGTGPAGLAGIPVRRTINPENNVFLIRPLLQVSRADIEAYAVSNGLNWRIDSSNTDVKYKRNAIRTEILPLIIKHFGSSALTNMARSIDLVRSYVDSGLTPSVDLLFDLLVDDDYPTALGIEGLVRLPSVWRRRLLLEALRRWLPGSPQRSAVARQIEALLHAQPGKRLVLVEGIVWRERDRLIFLSEGTEEAEQETAQEVFLYPGQKVVLPIGTIGMDILSGVPDRLDTGTNTTVFAEADGLQYPLKIRRWIDGDRFLPFGMSHEKKVSDFLTDIKEPSFQRRDVHVLVSGKTIIWVIGRRPAEHVRITPDTQQVARLFICE